MLIDKEAAYTLLKHEQYSYGISFSAEAYEKAARIVDQMHGADAAKIAKLCNEIEDFVNELYYSRENSIYHDERNAIVNKLEEIRKELTVNVPKPD